MTESARRRITQRGWFPHDERKSIAGGATVVKAARAVRSRLEKAWSAALVMAAVAAITTGVASPGSAMLLIGITPGTPISLEVTPQSAVVSVNDVRPACVVVLVKTALYGWSLGASYTTDRSVPVDMAVLPLPDGSCSIANNTGAAQHFSAGSTTTLLTNQRGSQALAYALLVRSSARLVSPVTVTLTFTADAPGATVAQAALSMGLDQSGHLAAMRP